MNPGAPETHVQVVRQQGQQRAFEGVHTAKTMINLNLVYLRRGVNRCTEVEEPTHIVSPWRG